jgi:nickel/cobalt transporter (NiCoT) family protein
VAPLRPRWGSLAAIAAIPLDDAEYGIVLLFLVAWLVALAVWRFGRIEEKWGSGLRADGSGSAVAGN